jgi:hypothetical protein
MALALGSSAQAATFYYGQLLTAAGSGTATLASDFDDLSVALSGNGLPNGGLVSDALSYQHTFEAVIGAPKILWASLSVGLVDDATPWSDLVIPNEMATITLDGAAWGAGQAVLNVLSGAVQVSTFEKDGVLGVTVTSNGTDFRVATSLFKVAYTDSPAPVVPEPGAIAVFALGALLAAGALRKRLAA